VAKNIKLNIGEKHLLDHVEEQEFRDHSLAKRKHQVVSQSMLSAIFGYGKIWQLQCESLLRENAGKKTDQQLLPTNQPFTISLRVVFIDKISERHHYKWPWQVFLELFKNLNAARIKCK
jgi:hypothetical protein